MKLQTLEEASKGGTLLYSGDRYDWILAYTVAEAGNGYLLELSNFDTLKDRLPADSFAVESFGGWFGGGQWLLVDPDNAEALDVVRQANKELAEYPVLDDELYAEYEYNEACDMAAEALMLETSDFALTREEREAVAPFVVRYAEDERHHYVDEEFYPTKAECFWGYVAYRRSLRD